MKHRHLNHEAFTIAGIEDILARGLAPDWLPLVAVIRADPYGEVAEKTRALCERPLFGAPVFRRVLAAARESRNPGSLPLRLPQRCAAQSDGLRMGATPP